MYYRITCTNLNWGLTGKAAMLQNGTGGYSGMQAAHVTSVILLQ